MSCEFSSTLAICLLSSIDDLEQGFPRRWFAMMVLYHDLISHQVRISQVVRHILETQNHMYNAD